MIKNNYFSTCCVLLASALIGLLVWSCANKGYPEGGPKDVTPPKVIEELPVSFSKNFKKKSVNIYFDEYVQLKNMNEKFIISPPQAKKPQVRLRGKYVMVEFQDSLRSGTTYSLDFADAIVDNNEGNPLGFYRYVFSTGDVIDTLELSGNVVDAETNEPVLNSYVFLYRNHADSVPINEIPDYMARTDSSGFFRITNLKSADYKVVTVMDENRNYKYTPEGEPIGFLDSLVTPVVFSMNRTDTLGKDSVVTTSYLAYGPNNLHLRLFKEKVTQLYMANEDRKQRELLNFVFSIPGENGFKIELLDTVVEGNWYLPEYSAGKDTINLWIIDSAVYKRDTLRFKLDYLKTDSLNRQVNYTDTVKLVFTDKKPAENNKRKKKTEEKPVVDFVKINTSLGTEQDLNMGIGLEFDKPLLGEEIKQHIKLFEKVDTIFEPTEFEFHHDSVKIRKYYIEKKWKPEGEYQLLIDSAAIFNAYGVHNNKFEKQFKVRSLEYYGKVFLDMKNVKGQVIVQLYKSEPQKTKDDKKPLPILVEKVVDKDGIITFDFLPEGKYRFRAILDENRNGVWDTGLYLKHIQPEEIKYLQAEINVKQNFDIEQEFNLEEPYTQKKTEGQKSGK